MPLAIDISVLGDKKLEKMLAKLEPKVQKRVMRKTLRASTKRLKVEVIKNLSGDPVHILDKRGTGGWAAQQKKVPVKALKRSRGRMGYTLPFPTREALGISPEDKFFYPAAVEYGHPRAPAKAPIRSAVNSRSAVELSIIAREIGRGIEREAMKG